MLENDHQVVGLVQLDRERSICWRHIGGRVQLGEAQKRCSIRRARLNRNRLRHVDLSARCIEWRKLNLGTVRPIITVIADTPTIPGPNRELERVGIALCQAPRLVRILGLRANSLDGESSAIGT
jgi:hypothetical protein